MLSAFADGLTPAEPFVKHNDQFDESRNLPNPRRDAREWLKEPENRQLLLDALRLGRAGNGLATYFDDAAMEIALTCFAAWWAGIDVAPTITTEYELMGGR